jgi:hypothetical protein
MIYPEIRLTLMSDKRFLGATEIDACGIAMNFRTEVLQRTMNEG